MIDLPVVIGVAGSPGAMKLGPPPPPPSKEASPPTGAGPPSGENAPWDPAEALPLKTRARRRRGGRPWPWGLAQVKIGMQGCSGLYDMGFLGGWD